MRDYACGQTVVFRRLMESMLKENDVPRDHHIGTCVNVAKKFTLFINSLEFEINMKEMRLSLHHLQDFFYYRDFDCNILP